jgi:dTDP-glucose pyrophosphorylase
MFAQPVLASFRRRTSLLYVSTRKSRSTTTTPMTIHSQSTTTVILGGVEAVVMAAGQGTRLRPLTERYAKPVLPIDGRPVIVTLLHELAFAERVVVVVGHLGRQVRALLDGFPAELRFVEQPEALGSGDAVARAEATPPYLVLAADTVFRPGDVGQFAGVEADGAIAVRKAPAPIRSTGMAWG